MFGRVPKNGAACLGTRLTISESHSEMSTRVPFCIARRLSEQARASARRSALKRRQAVTGNGRVWPASVEKFEEKWGDAVTVLRTGSTRQASQQ